MQDRADALWRRMKPHVMEVAPLLDFHHLPGISAIRLRLRIPARMID